MSNFNKFVRELEPNQIFVFGSNVKGEHHGGAAKQAYASFGAEWGVGEGLTGRCYAFPTLDENFLQVTDEELVKSRDLLYECALNNPQYEFLLTPVGTGIAGFPMEKIQKLFANCPQNIKKLF